MKFHTFYLQTRKNYDYFQRKLETLSSLKKRPIKTEEYVLEYIGEEFVASQETLEVKPDVDSPVKEEFDEGLRTYDENSGWEEIVYEPDPPNSRKNETGRKRKARNKKSKTTGEPYVCDLCGRTIQRFVDLRSHIEKTHLRLRKFQCHLCGDKFFASNNLRFHLTTHDNSRPRSQCKICGVLVLDLKKHFKVSHNDSNPVVCNICGKSLMNEMKLRYHTYKRHPPQGKYRCTMCNKDFCNALYLKEHMHQKHIGGFLYKCEWCDFQSNYSKNMPTHQKLKHKEEYEARRRARPPMMSRLHEMKATLALQGGPSNGETNEENLA